MGSISLRRPSTFFEVNMNRNIHTWYKVNKVLPSRNDIYQYCIEKGVPLKCITQIVSLIITGRECNISATEI